MDACDAGRAGSGAGGMKTTQHKEEFTMHGSLTLTREIGQTFFIGDTQITVGEVRSKKVRLNIKADKSTKILRGELLSGLDEIMIDHRVSAAAKDGTLSILEDELDEEEARGQ
jgi:sRNA-binding carbon storage regulator CsrA